MVMCSLTIMEFSWPKPIDFAFINVNKAECSVHNWIDK